MQTHEQTNPTSDLTPTTISWDRLLVPVDFSVQSRQAVKFAGRLAADMGSAVDLVFVVEPVPQYAGLEYTPATLDRTEITQEAQEELERWARREVPKGVSVEILIRYGRGSAEIVNTATQRKTDLIIIPTHGYSGVRRALLGSTTEQVLRRAPCAVLTLRSRTTPKRRVAVKRILVAVDFSTGSRQALAYAGAFALRQKAELIVFHTVLSGPVPRRMGGFARGLEAETLKYARTDLARIVKELVPAEVTVRQELIVGIPRDEIVRAASQRNADWIIMGTHGRRGLERWVMGSTAELVVRHAPCPVLVVRQTGP